MTRNAALAVIAALVAAAAAVLYGASPLDGASLRPRVSRSVAPPAGPVQPRQHPGRSPQDRIRAGALAFIGRVHNHGTFGHITAPVLGLRDWLVVEGTAHDADLSRGPGHYRFTTVPGLGGTVGLAGHDVTPVGGRPFGPFYYLPRLRPGARIVLRMAYGTFTYAVTGHHIYPNNVLTYERYAGRERLVLSMCWPRYTLRERFVVFAHLVKETPA